MTGVQTCALPICRAGFLTEETPSPIATVFLGSLPLLCGFSRDLYEAGIKCGSVAFPAVARNAAILRLAINARHTREELDQTVETLERLGKRYGILNRSRREILEIGERLDAGGRS